MVRSFKPNYYDWLLGSPTAGDQIIGMAGFESRPLRDRSSARPLWFPSRGATASPGVGALLRPAGRRVLPLLLSPVYGQIEQVIAVIHHLDASRGGPVSLKDVGSLSEVAHDMHPAYAASNQEGLERAQGRVPGHLPAHKVAVAGALFVRPLAENGEGDIARVKIGQLADLRGNPRASLALLRRRVAGAPHEVIGNELSTAL